MHFKNGDSVQLKAEYRGKWGTTVFTVDKMLKVNLQVITPEGRKMRGVPQMFEPANSTTSPQTKAEVKTVPLTFLTQGQVVLVEHELWKGGSAPFVVLKGSWGTNTVDLVKLGGDEHGRFWKKVPQHWCKKIELDIDLIKAMA